MALPIPKSDPTIELGQPTEDEFNSLETPEDEDLLATGLWDDNEDDDADEATEEE